MLRLHEFTASVLLSPVRVHDRYFDLFCAGCSQAGSVTDSFVPVQVEIRECLLGLDWVLLYA